MARKAKTDPFVSLFVDRHGKERCRFRRRGVSCYLPHPSDAGYRQAYRAALAGLAPTLDRQAVPRSVGDLVGRFYRTAAFLRSSDEWRGTVRGVLEPFREEFAADLVANFRFDHIEAILARKAARRTVAGRSVGGPSAAARLHGELVRLFALAVRLGWIAANPAAQAGLPVKVGRGGFHSWTEEEIARFQQRHPPGTRARLALELLLWTGVRRADAVGAGPRHFAGGRFRMTAGKTGKAIDLAVAPDLAAAVAAMPAVGIETLLVTDYGRPFTVAGFGNWFRDRCDEAGLPHCTAHGLRKALARRAADEGATQMMLKALGQWSSDRDVATYTAGANQRSLADAALTLVIAGRKG